MQRKQVQDSFSKDLLKYKCCFEFAFDQSNCAKLVQVCCSHKNHLLKDTERSSLQRSVFKDNSEIIFSRSPLKLWCEHYLEFLPGVVLMTTTIHNLCFNRKKKKKKKKKKIPLPCWINYKRTMMVLYRSPDQTDLHIYCWSFSQVHCSRIFV